MPCDVGRAVGWRGRSWTKVLQLNSLLKKCLEITYSSATTYTHTFYTKFLCTMYKIENIKRWYLSVILEKLCQVNSCGFFFFARKIQRPKKISRTAPKTPWNPLLSSYGFSDSIIMHRHMRDTRVSGAPFPLQKNSGQNYSNYLHLPPNLQFRLSSELSL